MKRRMLGATLALIGAASWGTAVRACNTLIIWESDLTLPANPPVMPGTAAALPALGKATVKFDFDHPGATFQVEMKDPRDVQQITLHVARTFSDPTGPVLFTLYDAVHGPLPALYTKRVGEADLAKQLSLKILTLADAVHAVLEGRAYVTVKTNPLPKSAKTASQAAVPQELSGFITMRKEEVFSNQPGDAVHDPALHRAALTSP